MDLAAHHDNSIRRGLADPLLRLCSDRAEPAVVPFEKEEAGSTPRVECRRGCTAHEPAPYREPNAALVQHLDRRAGRGTGPDQRGMATERRGLTADQPGPRISGLGG